MPNGHRKLPFSIKQKKSQIQAKRERKRNKNDDTTSSDENETETASSKTTEPVEITDKVKLINFQPKKTAEAKRDPNRFNLQFMRETPEDLKRHKKEASQELKFRDELELEIEIESVYKPNSALDMPIRPAWSYGMSREQLEQQERKYFHKYLERIFESYKGQELSYFEFNLETWRQLWRVLEISDIILLIVDIRFPPLHFSPVFYEHCTKQLKKDVILVLNKIDLVPTSVVIAWKDYFARKYPNLHVLLFSSAKQIKHRKNQPGDKKADKKSIDDNESAIKALSAEIYTARAHRQLYECVKNIVKSNVDLTTWSNLTENNLKNATSSLMDGNQPADSDLVLTNEETSQMDQLLTTNHERKKFEHGFVTIGCCGFPNVGKSSLLNSLNGRKVVSVSKTPGHTKHLQTIFLTKNVRLCDCPGLVFPSLVEKPLQVLAGIYPIAQLQQPYSAIRYISERVPIIDILKIKHPNSANAKPSDEDFVKNTWDWSPLDICEGWAIKRGYFTAKASRPDVYRAANELLRMALDGKICLSLKPIGYTKEKEYWATHPETKALDDMVRSVELTAIENLNMNIESLKNKKESINIDEDLTEYEDDNDFDQEILSGDDEKSGEEASSDEEQQNKFASNAYSLLSKEDD